MSTARPPATDLDQLFELASGQAGVFTVEQAAAAGYAKDLLSWHAASGNLRRLRRGIYRFVRFPPHEDEELVVLWLWSKQLSVFSHETALSLHQLSDILPMRTHLTVPLSWRKRRLRVPPGVALEYGDLRDDERKWVGAVPVTSVLRTLADCARAHVAQEFIDSAVRQALDRGLVSKDEIEQLTREMKSSRVGR